MMLALPFTRPPASLLVQPIVRAAQEEDQGRAGDISSELTIPADKAATARFVARKPGRIAGLICAEAAFRLIDPQVAFQVALPDGSEATAGSGRAAGAGPARGRRAAGRGARGGRGPL